MIQVQRLTKRFGDTIAVDDISFEVKPGIVTGFLGPNGAGKSTTMRMILGLDRPTNGSVTVNGRQYGQLPTPLTEVGALLDARAIQGGRGAFNHLHWVAAANGISRKRVHEVLDLVGLSDVERRKVGGFSLGMSQRLGIATALLGDPSTLLFDEPVNGLDPEGIRWIRNFLRRLASEGRTVLVSSHLMSEMEETADHVIVVGRGRIVADMGMREFMRQSGGNSVEIASPRIDELVLLLQRAGGDVSDSEDQAAVVTGLDAPTIGDIAGANGITLHALTPRRASLEAAFMEMTRESVQYQSTN